MASSLDVYLEKDLSALTTRRRKTAKGLANGSAVEAALSDYYAAAVRCGSYPRTKKMRDIVTSGLKGTRIFRRLVSEANRKFGAHVSGYNIKARGRISVVRGKVVKSANGWCENLGSNLEGEMQNRKRVIAQIDEQLIKLGEQGRQLDQLIQELQGY